MDLNGDRIIECTLCSEFNAYASFNGWVSRVVDLIPGTGLEILCRWETNRVGTRWIIGYQPVILQNGEVISTNLISRAAWVHTGMNLWSGRAIDWSRPEAGLTNVTGRFSTNGGYLGLRFPTVDGLRVGWIGRGLHVAESWGQSWQPDPDRPIRAGEVVPPSPIENDREAFGYSVGSGQAIDLVVRRRFRTNEFGMRTYSEILVQPLGGIRVLLSENGSSRPVAVEALEVRRMIGAEPYAGTRWSDLGQQSVLLDVSGAGPLQGRTNIYIGIRRESDRYVTWTELSAIGNQVQAAAFKPVSAVVINPVWWLPTPPTPTFTGDNIDLDGDGWSDLVYGSIYRNWAGFDGVNSYPGGWYSWNGFFTYPETQVQTATLIDRFMPVVSERYRFLSRFTVSPTATLPVPFVSGALIGSAPPATNSPPIEPGIRLAAGAGIFCTGWSGMLDDRMCCPDGDGMPPGVIGIWMRKPDGWHAGWINGAQWYISPHPNTPVVAGERPPQLRQVVDRSGARLTWPLVTGFHLESLAPDTPGAAWTEVPIPVNATNFVIPFDASAKLFRLIRR